MRYFKVLKKDKTVEYMTYDTIELRKIEIEDVLEEIDKSDYIELKQKSK